MNKRAFYKDSSRSDGLSPVCKLCRKAISKTYYQENKQQIAKQQTQYYDENRKKILKKKAEYQKNRKLKDPLYKLSSNLRTLVKMSFINKGFSKSSKTAQILGCSFEEFQAHLRHTFEENYGIPFSWIDESLLHIDHIIPLCSAKTKEDLVKLNHYTNLQYLLADDNLEKGSSF